MANLMNSRLPTSSPNLSRFWLMQGLILTHCTCCVVGRMLAVFVFGNGQLDGVGGRVACKCRCVPMLLVVCRRILFSPLSFHSLCKLYSLFVALEAVQPFTARSVTVPDVYSLGCMCVCVMGSLHSMSLSLHVIAHWGNCLGEFEATRGFYEVRKWQ